MFRYYCAPETDLDTIARQGLHAAKGVACWDSLASALEACTGPILVVNTRLLPHGYDAAHVAAEAIVNLSPYRPPRPVTAAGGYVIRPNGSEPEALVIFRRGVWDLPKGKLDRGETVEACALREVREEIGVADLHLLKPASTTVHGYDDGGAYAVKTTYWFLMRTAETDFTPQKEEDIEQVAWMPWSQAVACIGFDTLRDHMRGIMKTAAQALDAH